MTAGEPVLRISVLLSDLGREKYGRGRVIEFLDAHALKQTGGGIATLSFVAEPEVLAIAFGPQANTETSTTRTSDAVGGGRFGEVEIPIPAELEPYVDAISVAPPARGFAADE